MKKVFVLLLISVFMLTGCGSSDELKDFAEAFNARAASEDVPELIPDEFGKMQEEDGEKWRELYESEKYTIDAYYEGKKLTMYALDIDGKEPFADKEGEGYNAGIMIARALGLSVSKYADNFEEALKAEDHSYTEKGYKITFINMGFDSPSLQMSFIVHFEKK